MTISDEDFVDLISEFIEDDTKRAALVQFILEYGIPKKKSLNEILSSKSEKGYSLEEFVLGLPKASEVCRSNITDQDIRQMCRRHGITREEFNIALTRPDIKTAWNTAVQVSANRKRTFWKHKSA